MRVAVIGAGIGGLAVANGLQRAGIEVEVLERAAGPRRSGSGLSIFGNGWTALDVLGVGATAREVAGDRVTGLRAGQRTPDGRWLSTTPAEALRRLRIVHRNDLHDVLADGLEPGTVRYGVAARVDGTDGLVRTEPPGAPAVTAYDVVVGADGIRSGVREELGLDTGVRYAGRTAWRGITRHAVDLGDAAGETWGRGLRFGYAPLRDGRVYWFAVASMPADRHVPDDLAHLTAAFGEWHQPVTRLLEDTDPAAVSRLPVEHLRSPLTSYARGRCVLLGDAAHAMTPDLGQGGNQALEDAATLTALLRPLSATPGPDEVAAALHRYDRERRPRTQAIAARASTVGRVAQASGWLSAPLRDAVVRLVPEAATAKQLLAIQAWQP